MDSGNKLPLKAAVKLLLDQGNTVTEVAAKMDISGQDIKDLMTKEDIIQKIGKTKSAYYILKG